MKFKSVGLLLLAASLFVACSKDDSDADITVPELTDLPVSIDGPHKPNSRWTG